MIAILKGIKINPLVGGTPGSAPPVGPTPTQTD